MQESPVVNVASSFTYTTHSFIQFKISPGIRNFWEGLFIEMYGGSLRDKIVIGNIYRPP